MAKDKKAPVKEKEKEKGKKELKQERKEKKKEQKEMEAIKEKEALEAKEAKEAAAKMDVEESDEPKINPNETVVPVITKKMKANMQLAVDADILALQDKSLSFKQKIEKLKSSNNPEFKNLAKNFLDNKRKMKYLNELNSETKSTRILKVGSYKYSKNSRAEPVFYVKINPSFTKDGKAKKPEIVRMQKDGDKFVEIPSDKPKDGTKLSEKDRILQTPVSYPLFPKQKRKLQKKVNNPPKLRNSLKPGTICIVVAGRQKGKRVVFLKQLESGLCLVTGPFEVNRCPLRRIGQQFLIATSTSIPLGKKFFLPDTINDEFFRRQKLITSSKKSKKEDGSDEEEESDEEDENALEDKRQKPKYLRDAKKYKLTKKRVLYQMFVDRQLMRLMYRRPEYALLRKYLMSKFKLTNGVYPHLIKF